MQQTEHQRTARQERYDREQKATLPRSELGFVPRVQPPSSVERRVFHEPCFFCNASGECRHRRVA